MADPERPDLPQSTDDPEDRRRAPDEPVRAAFTEGAEEDSLRRLGRGLTADKLERVPLRYPGRRVMPNRGRELAPMIAAALLFAACGGRTFVGEYPIGGRLCQEAVDVDPAESSPWFCRSVTDFARSTLDTNEPNHPGVESAEAYRSDYRDSEGRPVWRIYGTAAGDAIVVLYLSDRSVRPFWVTCGGTFEVHCSLTEPSKELDEN